MLSERSEHRQWAINKIKESLESYEVRPILFVGSGLSQRYIDDAPSWDGLLEKLINICPDDYVKNDLMYYKQTCDSDFGVNPAIGTELADAYADWAWNEGKESDEFPDRIYEQGNKEMFIKHKVSEYFKDISPDSVEDIDKNQEEIELLRDIGAHAIITTNYDTTLESIFPEEYNVITGESVYDIDFTSIGEIFKIHGCATEPESIVLTEDDYKKFMYEKRYLTSKLLTYFAEHPVIILGYDAGDLNVTSILSDLNTVRNENEKDLLDNIFHLNHSRGISDGEPDEKYRVINHEDGGRTRIRSISAENYSWVYETASYDSELSAVKVKHLRDLVNSTYSIVTEDAPRKDVQIEILQQTSEEKELSSMVGLLPMDDDSNTSKIIRQLLIDKKESDIEEDENLETKLALSTLTWLGSPDQTLNSIESILRYRKNADEVDLNQDRIKHLLNSSLENGFHGGDWLARVEEDAGDILQDLAENVSKKNKAQRLETICLALGKEEPLRLIATNTELEEYNLNTREFMSIINHPAEERINRYGPGEKIRYPGGEAKAVDLIGNNERTEEILNSLTDALLGEIDCDFSTEKTHFRKAELIDIYNKLKYQSS
jgi:hypothetical protein